MKAKLAYIFYDHDFPNDPEIFFVYPEYKKWQGKIIAIVYFEIEDEN